MRLLQIGVDPSTARFSSGSEESPFSLRVSTEQAELLGQHLNKDLDIQFTYRRGRTGRIEEGYIEQVYPMEVDDDGTQWRGWLTETGRHWNEIDDQLEEVGRRDD